MSNCLKAGNIIRSMPAEQVVYNTKQDPSIGATGSSFIPLWKT